MDKYIRTMIGAAAGILMMGGSLYAWHSLGMPGLVAFIVAMVGAGVVTTSLSLDGKVAEEDEE